MLSKLGAASVIGRDEVNDARDRPLLSARWAGGIDTVGSNTLATLLRSTKNGGCVAACGLVGGDDLSLTVFPFILRGITLAGIDSAFCPHSQRVEIWRRLAGDWCLPDLESLATTVDLSSLGERVGQILAGGVTGRVIVNLRGDESHP